MHEASGLLRIILSAHFQGILDLLSCHLCHTSHVSKWEYSQCILICNGSGLNICADASAIAKSDVCSQLNSVSICRQITKISFAIFLSGVLRWLILDRQLVRCTSQWGL